MTLSSRCSDQSLSHAIEDRRATAGSRLGDQAGASHMVGRGVWLRLGADESQRAYSLGRLTPQFQ